MALIIVTQPAVEPINLAELKLHLRIDHDDEDLLLDQYRRAARQDVESLTRRALITQTWEFYLDAFPDDDEIELPLPPLQSVTYVRYTPRATGAETEWNASNYRVDSYSEPGRIVLRSDGSYPGDELVEVNGIRIRYVAGYGDAPTDVPAPIRQAILLLAASYYENREAVIIGRTVTAIPHAVDALLYPYRVFRW